MRVILEGGPRDGDAIEVRRGQWELLVPIPEEFDWTLPMDEALTAEIRVGRYLYRGSARHFVQIWEYDGAKR